MRYLVAACTTITTLWNTRLLLQMRPVYVVTIMRLIRMMRNRSIGIVRTTMKIVQATRQKIHVVARTIAMSRVAVL
jgi:hypothetical protein